jgi:hypothetical protein
MRGHPFTFDERPFRNRIPLNRPTKMQTATSDTGRGVSDPRRSAADVAAGRGQAAERVDPTRSFDGSASLRPA